MPKGIYQMPFPMNEPVNDFAPGSIERESLLNKYEQMYSQEPIKVPLYIGNEEIHTDRQLPMNPPHDHKHTLGHFSMGDKNHVEKERLQMKMNHQILMKIQEKYRDRCAHDHTS